MNINYRKYKEGSSVLNAEVGLLESKAEQSLCLFCGQPHMYLVIWRSEDNKVKGSIGIGDNDDFDYYQTFENPMPEQIHEMINWLKDHEHAEISLFTDIENYIEDISYILCPQWRAL